MTQSAEHSTALHLYLFGHVRIERAEEAVRLPTRKTELLLAYLALHPDPHSREKLAARFWPDVPDAAARASLRNALSTLRRKVGRQLLQANRQTAQINAGYPLWVDAVAFRTEATSFLAAPAADPSAVNLALYKDDLLVDFYDDWVLAERDAFRTLYLDTLLELTQQMRAQSAYERAIDFAEQALATERANERAHQHMMFCHVALGNRAAALRQYEVCRSALRDELDVEPSPATKKLRAWIEHAPAGKAPVEASITNLPIPLTTFVGRQQETVAVKELLGAARLLTLTGAGGSGKTRLAIQVATDLLDAYSDGVWWVELAALADAELLPRTVAKALGVPEVPQQTTTETLVNFLRSKRLLLVLDNCEHLIAAAARLVERLLSACPDVKVLATSREPLGIPGERVWPVPALSLPDAQHSLPVDQLRHVEAIDLFVGRAAAVTPDFELTEKNAPAVTDICRRLDGLPLAIELAAARTNVLAVEQIAARLDNAFQLLTDGSRTALPRHQTLRAAIDWSHDLLSEEEQALLRRLAVFAGGWTLAAAEKVCAGDGIGEDAVFDLLSRLVDKSLVEVQTRGEEARFRMLQTIRQYSQERLSEAGEGGATRDRHLDYHMRLVEAADPHLGYFLTDVEAERWLGRLEPEVDNVRAAIRWSLATENGSGDGRQAKVEAGLRLAGSLHWFWSARGRFSEGRAWLERLLATGADVPAPVQAQALLTAGYMACWQGDFASGRTPLREALGLYRRIEDGGGIACALHGLGFVAMGEGDVALSQSRFEKSLQGARDADVGWLTSFALHFLAIVHTYQGDYAQASSFFEEGDTIIEQIGGPKQGLAFSQFHLGRIARLEGDYAAARSHHGEGMRLFQEIGDRRGIGYSLAGLAVLAAAQGDMERAARLSGAVAALEAVVGSFLEAPLQMEYDQVTAGVREALGEEVFAVASAEGQAMNMERAIAYALQ